MTLYIIGALVLWLIGGVVVGVLIGPRLRARASDAELFRRAVEQDAEWRKRMMQ
jgi:uncharacterized membrane protein YfcA